jgi:hypothetical protein
MIFICQKTKEVKNDFIMNLKEEIIFTNFDIKNVHKSLSDVCFVKTGNIVWNKQSTSIMKNIYEKDYKMLIYTRNLVENKLQIKEDSKKFQFIKTKKEAITLPVILCSRTKDPKFVLVKEFEYPLIAENHIILIYPKDEITIENLYDFLVSVSTKEYIKSISHTCNITNTQLLSIPY